MTATLDRPTEAAALAEQADILDRAASLIEANGLAEGNFWPFDDYRDGEPCCTVGAVGVALGLRTLDGLNVIGASGATPLHPALVALLLHLHETGQLDEDTASGDVALIFGWSDDTPQFRVVATLREVAAKLRGSA